MSNQITQAQDGHNQEPVYPRIYIPDYTDEFKFLNRQIQQFLESDHYQVLNATALRMEKYAKSIPLVFDVKNHHHFEWGSKTLMFLIIGCVLSTFGSIYFGVNRDNELKKVNARNLALQQQSARNADEAQYFYLVRGHYPEIVKQINKRIAQDSIGYLKAADEKIKAQNLKKEINMNIQPENSQEYFPPLALTIVTDRYDRPISVAVPLSDWEKLRPSLHPKSPLYLLMQKLCAETTDSEVPYVSASSGETEEIEQREIVYKNELCTEPGLFVLETAKQKDLIMARYTSETFGFVERL